MALTEAEIQKSILNALGAMPEIRIWRTNTGRAYPLSEIATANRQNRPPIPREYNVPGHPDLSGMTHDGRWLGVEVKRPGSKLRENQKRFRKMVQKMGGIYIVAHSSHEAISKITRKLKETKACGTSTRSSGQTDSSR